MFIEDIDKIFNSLDNNIFYALASIYGETDERKAEETERINLIIDENIDKMNTYEENTR